MAIAVRQACRALQGKTYNNDPFEIMTDEQHNSRLYKSWLKGSLKNSDRPIFFYESMEIAPLFLYGYYSRAIELGDSAMELISTVWSARNTRFLMFIHSLSVAGLMWSKMQDPLRAVSHGKDGHHTDVRFGPTDKELLDESVEVVKKIKTVKKLIEDWQAVNDVNYLSWSTLLGAQIAEMEGDHGNAMKNYEKSLDHSSAHGFLFEEALGNYLQAGFFLRTGSRRAAKGALREALTLYRSLGATGVADISKRNTSCCCKGQPEAKELQMLPLKPTSRATLHQCNTRPWKAQRRTNASRLVLPSLNLRVTGSALGKEAQLGLLKVQVCHLSTCWI